MIINLFYFANIQNITSFHPQRLYNLMINSPETKVKNHIYTPCVPKLDTGLKYLDIVFMISKYVFYVILTVSQSESLKNCLGLAQKFSEMGPGAESML